MPVNGADTMHRTRAHAELWDAILHNAPSRAPSARRVAHGVSAAVVRRVGDVEGPRFDALPEVVRAVARRSLIGHRTREGSGYRPMPRGSGRISVSERV